MHWAVSQNMWNKTHQRRPCRAMSLATVRVCPIRSRQFATPGIERGISLAEATVSSRQPDIGGRRRGIQKSVRARTAPRSAGSAGLALAQHLDDTPLQLCPHHFVPRGLLLSTHPLAMPCLIFLFSHSILIFNSSNDTRLVASTPIVDTVSAACAVARALRVPCLCWGSS